MRKLFSLPPAILFCILILALYSCQKDIKAPAQNNNQAIFPTTEKQKETVATIKEVGNILQEVYQNPKAFYEVCATIYSGYYEDERVLLKDLLFPEYSKLYSTSQFISLRSEKGLFKKEFLEAFNKGDYPNLKKAFGLSSNSNSRITAATPTDTSMEIFSNSNGVAIYFPYSDNFAVPLTKEYFDQINTYPGYKATIVSADREANSGPGQEPYACGTIQNRSYCFRTVTVDDAYAETRATHIVNTGGGPIRTDPPPPPPGTSIERVFLGWGKLNTQYDKFISFNRENGGGSEIKVCRISGYLQFQNQQVTNFAGDQVAVDFTRKQIRRGLWKRVYGVWDADWVVDNKEQVMAIYEEDNEGTQTFSGSVGTTIRLDSAGNNTVTGSIGYSITVKTQDELILQSKYTRIAYFGAAKADQAWGFQMCDTKGGACRYDNTFLSSGNWPIYNGGASWNYTWPYNSL